MLQGLPLAHLHPCSVVERGGPDETNNAPVSKVDEVQPDGQKEEAFGGESTSSPSRAGKDASGKKMALVAFFSWELTIPASLL